METAIVALMEAQGGVASGVQLTALPGVTRHTVDALVRAKVLVRVRRGSFVLGRAFAGATAWERAELQARAVGRSLAADPGGHHALSHESALMMHGLPYFGDDGLVHLVRFDGGRGRHDDTIFVHRPVEVDWLVTVDGLHVVRPALAALQVAALHGAEAGLVCLDGVLHQAETRDRKDTGERQGLAHALVEEDIERALQEGFGTATRVVHEVAQLADGRSESVGESRSRWLLQLLGFGPLLLQFPVDLGDRTVYADLKLGRWAVLIEFDGRIKYGHPDALHTEKLREDALRALGYEVVRLTWGDLVNSRLVRQKILAAIARAEAAARATA
ncbi:type IV toxin-antitoxin system AbiEi family antitoxin domain-containing protein [Ornithinimicrobium pratense]|uniref:Type IV toxin-antitoxin system AbiEi family antitoxin domain-containing protein n=1 Tax=Ornithinimicrobium pratense TaxID=2593973 RepID=A0A5J6V8D9_9MICO|nr:type IV toxin-antitoxin system AbiEi family antitoxin domain-containing protein [Ornithinimicrobium pratense]QFG69333.1 type IV toxin-antitoxin system AbiEi family antitoxin domain-containing protein [Ornithinimicrobium pratense]